jgi:ABC-type arginine transport system permease subunit
LQKAKQSKAKQTQPSTFIFKVCCEHLPTPKSTALHAFVSIEEIQKQGGQTQPPAERATTSSLLQLLLGGTWYLTVTSLQNTILNPIQIQTVYQSFPLKESRQATNLQNQYL